MNKNAMQIHNLAFQLFPLLVAVFGGGPAASPRGTVKVHDGQEKHERSDDRSVDSSKGLEVAVPQDEVDTVTRKNVLARRSAKTKVLWADGTYRVRRNAMMNRKDAMETRAGPAR